MIRSFLRGLLLLACLAPGAAMAVDYVVNSEGSEPDANPGAGGCATAGGTCTLHAAIMEGNALAGPHTVTFAPSVETIVLSTPLPRVTRRFTFDGINPSNAASGGRVVIDGGQVNGCFDLTELPANPGARFSTVKNFVIRRCQGAGISLSGHGYTITGNRIGTNPAGSATSSGFDANTAEGIKISGTVTPPAAAAPNILALVADPPQTLGAIAAYSFSLQSILQAVAAPNLISGNVVSGNNGVGILIFGQGTVNTIVTGNIVGLSADGLATVPNGRGPGNKDGIRLESTAWGNFIGPGNIVSGNNGSGIALQSGAVLLPNFVAGNLVGLGSAPTDVGNAENGITVGSHPNGSMDAGLDNPTGFAAFIGPANTIADNRSDAGGASLDAVSADDSGGLLVEANSRGIEVFANVVGLGTFPAGSTPLGQLQFGNRGNGMVIGAPNVRISRNLILANGRHGILLKGADTTNTRIFGNFIGVSVPTGLSPLVALGNTGDGIHIFSAGSSVIGGPAASDRNTIAANGRNGIALRQGSNSAGWANLIQRNAIYGNARSGTGIGIDLERVPNAPDGFNPFALPENYANFDQVAPILCGGGAQAPECGVGDGPLFGGNATTLRWTLPLRPQSPSRPVRLEFFSVPADGSGMNFLGEQQVTVNTAGQATGSGCVDGICVSSVGGSTDTSGQSIVATATDLLAADVPPVGDGAPNSASNNTSEFSLPLGVRRTLEVATTAPLPPGTTNTPYSLAFQAVGGSGTYTQWAVTAGSVPGLALAAGSGVLSGMPSSAGTFNFTVRVTDSDGVQAIRGYAITVAQQPPLTITTAPPLPGGTVGSPYSLTLAASGGSGGYTGWSVAVGSLPPGLSLGSGTGALTGTPSAVGSFDFVVQVSDSNANLATRSYTLTVAPAPVPLAISTAPPLPAATQGADYAAQLSASGGSGLYAGWSISAGALPPGIAIDPASGALAGRPTAAGSFAFTARVMDSLGASATRAYAINVAPAPPPPPPPSFTITPSRVDFGEVRVGSTATVPVVVRNISRAAFNPNIEILGSAAQLLTSPFSASDGTCGSTLAVGASCTLNVTFRPRTGRGVVASGTARVSTPLLIGFTQTLGDVPLRGVGVGRLVDLAPTAIDFGTQRTGTTTSVGISITNPTGSRLRLSGGALTSSAGFTGPFGSCGSTIEAGASCTIIYRFVPAVPGAFDSSTRLRFEQDSGVVLPAFSDAFDIFLSGIGTDVLQATSTRPVALDFGAVPIGRSATLLVTTQNLSAANVSVTGGTFPSADTTWARGPACANPTAPSASCLLDFSFLPRETIGYAINTALTITQGGQSRQVSLSLAGEGTGTLAQVSPAQLDLGRVRVGGSNSAQVAITNTSEVTLAITRSLATPFEITVTTCGASLAPDASCSITYRLDGDVALIGPQAADARIRLENVAGGYLQQVTVGLTGEVVDGIFGDGFE